MNVLGIDIGGTGIKGAPVDVQKGALRTERFRIPTPRPALPNAVASVVRQIAKNFKAKGPIGITFPGVVKSGIIHTAPNMGPEWLGVDAQALFSKATGCRATVLNDADAAGIAEMRFGAGAGRSGLVMTVTLGTGIGTALFYNGVLVPNSELGHIEVRGKDAEKRASDRIRETKDLSWKKWAKNVNEYLQMLEMLLNPELFIIGGGVSKKWDKVANLIEVKAKVVPARLLNDAGIVGAALSALDRAPDVKPGKATRKRSRK